MSVMFNCAQLEERPMKTMLALGIALAAVFGLAMACSAGDQPKVLEVGKDLKVEAKISDDDRRFDFSIDFGGKSIDLKMQAKVYSVKLEAGRKYTITMDTDVDDFDPFLVVHDPKGNVVAFDDDSGGNLNAKLNYYPAKDGTYKVYAAALRGTGTYTL